MSMELDIQDDAISINAKIWYRKRAEEIINDELEKHIKAAIVDELAKSPEFQEAIRKLAIEKLWNLVKREGEYVR